MKNKILEELNKIERNGMDFLIKWLCNSDYFEAPASTRFHGNFKGGLAEHCYKVLKVHRRLDEAFKTNLSAEYITITSLLHDACKINFYTTEKRNRKVDGKWESYDAYIVEDQEPLGHGAKSIILLNKFIKLTQMETYAILWHMGRPNDYVESMSYESALEKFPSTLLLHVADNISTKMYEKTVK